MAHGNHSLKLNCTVLGFNSHVARVGPDFVGPENDTVGSPFKNVMLQIQN